MGDRPHSADIRLYDSASRSKRPLRPLDPADVRMYVCGPTVYDRAHIGNARPVVVFDVLYRLLRHVYGEGAVTYVRNFTDIDDKINKRAAETRGPDETTLDAIRRITTETIGWYHEDMAALGALPPTHEPRATEHVPGMIAMIETLIEKGCAYEAEGHVLFHVPAWERYGSLSGRPLHEMEAGARVDVAPYKRSPLDFVLWKPSDETLPGWDSPWGRGRPGWHIECSVMAKALLGTRFDIHGGGIDLQFPHHENELAQSCCANGTDAMASIWMHNGYLMVEGEKMSKSLGNFFTVRDLLDKSVPGEVIRLALLMSHYRQPLDWNSKRKLDADRTTKFWADRLARYPLAEVVDVGPSEVSDEVLEPLMDDLNTADAISAITRLAKSARSSNPSIGRKLRASARLLGFEIANFTGFNETLARHAAYRKEIYGVVEKALAQTGIAAVETKIKELLDLRERARRDREFKKADAIRDALIAAGVELRDTPAGPEFAPTAEFNAAKVEEIKP